MPQCERCGKSHDGTFASGRFCSLECSKARTISSETYRRVGLLKKRRTKYVTFTCRGCESTTRLRASLNRQYCSEECKRRNQQRGKNFPKNIWEISARTRCKIIKRIAKGCFRCGWNEASCDVHHIHGKKIENFNDHTNLTILCPNCHRMAQTGVIPINEIEKLSLQIIVGDSWKNYYHG